MTKRALSRLLSPIVRLRKHDLLELLFETLLATLTTLRFLSLSKKLLRFGSYCYLLQYAQHSHNGQLISYATQRADMNRVHEKHHPPPTPTK